MNISGVSGRVVKFIDPSNLGLNPIRDFGLFYVRKLSMQLGYGTLVVLLGCPLVPKIMYGGAPESKA
jgi:hypothetical protein